MPTWFRAGMFAALFVFATTPSPAAEKTFQDDALNDAAVGRAHGINGDSLSLPLGLFSQTQGHVLQALSTALTVVFRVEDDLGLFLSLSVTDDAREEVLQCLQGLSSVPDQEPAALSLDVENNLVFGFSRLHLNSGVDAHEL